LLWNLAVAAVIVWADRKLRLGHGRVFALYVAGYTHGRTWIEMMRTDPATHVFGVRVNVWVSILVFLGAVVYFVLARKRGDREPPELLRGTEPGEKAEDDDSAEAEAEPVNLGANSGTDGDEPKQERRLARVRADGDDDLAPAHGDDVDVGVVVAGYPLRCEHLRGWASGHHLAAVEQQHPVGVLAGERQVVQRRDHRRAVLPAQPVDQGEQRLRVPEVQPGRRLIQ